MTALVAGATGIVGRRLVEQLVARGRAVLALSRSGAPVAGQPSVAVDLTDPAALARLPGLAGVTQVFYAAQTRQGDAVEAAMLRHLLEAVEAVAPGLAHVHLVHGTRYYGSHLGPFRVPAREDDARHAGANFYFDQQDHLLARQAGKRWTWSICRPHTFCDSLPGLRSLPRLLAIYGAILRALDMPLVFPGTEGNFHALYQCTDVSHLARGIVWMADTPACGNQVFNITNGTPFRWAELWPSLADALGMAPGPVQTLRMAEFMADKAPVWERLVATHGLQPTPFAETALWPYADYVFQPDWDIISDTSKIRRFGFAEQVDNAAMFAGFFDHFRAQRLIP